MDSMQIRDDEGYVPRCREPGCPGRDTGSAMTGVEPAGFSRFKDELGELLVRHGHATEWSQVYYALPEVTALIEAMHRWAGGEAVTGALEAENPWP